MEGTVKWFNKSKGFGFILGEDGKEYFVHHSAIQSGFIRDNDLVSFDPNETDKGVQAQNVQLLKKGSERVAEGEVAPEQEASAEEQAEAAAPAEEPAQEEPQDDSEDFGEEASEEEKQE